MSWSPPFSSRPQDKARGEPLHGFCWATHRGREKDSPGADRPPRAKSGDLGLRTVTRRRVITSRGGTLCLHQAQLWSLCMCFLWGEGRCHPRSQHKAQGSSFCLLSPRPSLCHSFPETLGDFEQIPGPQFPPMSMVK